MMAECGIARQIPNPWDDTRNSINISHKKPMVKYYETLWKIILRSSAKSLSLCAKKDLKYKFNASAHVAKIDSGWGQWRLQDLARKGPLGGNL